MRGQGQAVAPLQPESAPTQQQTKALCGGTTAITEMPAPSASSPAEKAEPAPSEPKCSNCHRNPVVAPGLCLFDDWCAECDASLHASQFDKDIIERPCFAGAPGSSIRTRFPRPPPNPLGFKPKTKLLCPCGFCAISIKPLSSPRPGKENRPLHRLVTVPLSSTAHIIMCIVCEATFKHHRNAVKHMHSHRSH